MRNLQDISVQYLKGVGPARKKILSNLGIESIEDLLYFFPRRYEDRTQVTPLNQIKIGEFQTVTGKVIVGGGHRSWFTKKHVFETAVGDESGRLFCVWFNQPFLENYFRIGEQVVLHGKVEIYKNRLQMVSPEYEMISPEDQSLSMGRIVPIYSLTKGISQRYLRRIIRAALDQYAGQIQEVLPYDIRKRHNLSNIVYSINNIHFPENVSIQDQSYKRIAFEEFFFFQVSVIMRRLSLIQKKGIAHKIPDGMIHNFSQIFPFNLTKAQQRVIGEMITDMKKTVPMLRLLQGDVGSGKTLVAFFGCVAAIENGFQAAVMAPTEILARQHFENMTRLAKRWSFKEIRTALLVSTLKKVEREDILQKVKEGTVDLLIGTHALLEKEVQFKNLSFAVVDEQHKFGIRQRALLSDKGTNPDVLIMTATPIPRTLCLTLYGDLDVSVLDELPPGRGQVETRLASQEKAAEIYNEVNAFIKEGRQAFIVYPLIEESEKVDLKAAVKQFQHFGKHEFKDWRLGLVHGQMSRQETQAVMDNFKNKKIDILVATTVVEVGVDVPKASVMIIEHAERFGLAQLHQLRGRIGRGSAKGYCFLIADPQTEEAQARLKAILSMSDGFKIAQADLEIRGPGEFFGRHQHGLNELKVANPATQIDILEAARKEAIALAGSDPRLEKDQHPVIRSVIQKRYPNYLSAVSAG